MLALIHLNKYGINKHYFENINQVRKSLILSYMKLGFASLRLLFFPALHQKDHIHSKSNSSFLPPYKKKSNIERTNAKLQ